MTNPETGSPEPDEVVDETVEAPADEVTAETFEEEPVDVEPAAEDAADSAPADAQVTELTEALQRERAQFANFRRRSAEEALQSVARGKQVLVEKLLPILDDLDRAREHGDLEEGPLRALSDKLGEVLAGEKLVKFAEPGDDFDPEIHEAIQHEGSGDTPVLGLVYRAGYRLGDKVIRTAMVTVTDPA
ncbi:nucleotide exchange factor GrpE [Gordonia sp. HY002]|uniref:nucleotide exchange factor GrpE n=1 Tax=Gordonia zhenghanii TaxID=2911516 RepID=UPI001EF0F8DB|nr:nucleotide exchange factor GrpE [Gordonia zhenghanii]MCF8570985.1 nucleotide exchange factor GrpE [Gordonia zhenghanii]MCF8604728.1 nucleotide exchange factor GrpE [Gordonia zhenghanii]